MTQQAPNLAGIDFSQYRSWQQITTPRGGVYYVVPGTPYVYDPFASAARGQTVLYLNPKPEMEDRERQIDAQNAATRAQSPEGQLIPVVGTVGGTAAGAYFYNNNPFASKPTGNSNIDTQPVAQPTAQPTAQPVAQATPTTPAQGFQQGAQTGSPVVAPTNNTIPAGAAVPEGYTAVGSSADGGTMIAPTSQVDKIPPEALNDQGFLQSVNWGQVVQGGLALAQLYSAYKSYQKGDYTGATITGAAGAGNLALASGAASQSGTLGSTVIPGLNIVAGAYTGYQTAEAMSDMAAGSQRTTTGVAGGAASGAAIGAGVGVYFFGVGAVPGAIVGAIVGGLAGLAGDKFGSSKGKAQFMRDNIRRVLQDNKILDENYQGTLADGSKYDFGVDGSKLKWKELDKIAADNKPAWDAATPLGDALAAGYGFVGQKAADINGMYLRAAVSNANNDPETARANMRHFARQQGFTYEMIKAKLDEAKADGRIDEAQYNYYLGGAQQLVPPGSQPPASAPAKPGVPQPGVPQAAAPQANTPQAGGVTAPPAPTAPKVGPPLPPRSRTSSPGIDKQGRRISYNVQMGRDLADRFNKRGR
jgi:hypothetical protein